MSVVHIYRIPQVVELTLGSGGALMNYSVNRTDFRLFRHVDNQIDFWVKNVDRKSIAMANTSTSVHITHPHTQRVIMTRDLEVVDAAKGHMRLFISGEEAAALPPGALRYSAVVTNTVTNVQTILFTDRDRKGSGVVEVTEGPIPDPPEPIRLSFSEFILRNGKYYSEALEGAALVQNYSGQHSLAINLAAFSGKFTVQGSLEENPSALDTNWFNIDYRLYQNDNGLVHFPFEGNVLWVRFVVEVGSGTIEKIEYRN